MQADEWGWLTFLFFLVFVGSLIALFFKRTRRTAKWSTLVGFIGLIIAFFGLGIKVTDDEARRQGFARADDQRTATEATRPKRDIQGFRLGMPPSEYIELRHKRCITSPPTELPMYTPDRAWILSDGSTSWQCHLADGSDVTYVTTPYTRRFYQVSIDVYTNMTCSEFIAYVA